MQVQLLTNYYGTPSFTYAKSGDAGIDLQAHVEHAIIITPGEVKLIPTGVKLNMQNTNMVGFVLPRSGLGHKQGLICGNGTGVIDSGYQGEVMVSAWNRSNETIVINPMDRIAQIVFTPIIRVDYEVVSEFTDTTDRGTGGFGSTGV